VSAGGAALVGEVVLAGGGGRRRRLAVRNVACQTSRNNMITCSANERGIGGAETVLGVLIKRKLKRGRCLRQILARSERIDRCLSTGGYSVAVLHNRPIRALRAHDKESEAPHRSCKCSIQFRWK
jgi:hypothetical protein